mmetsp:Transcript_36024/g.84674  ORF Transcript_36024/g.84674 Transcript_36024/m.84674 type:complete len:223 (-) Transcript_36024:825-1493(-)
MCQLTKIMCQTTCAMEVCVPDYMCHRVTRSELRGRRTRGQQKRSRRQGSRLPTCARRRRAGVPERGPTCARLCAAAAASPRRAQSSTARPQARARPGRRAPGPARGAARTLRSTRSLAESVRCAPRAPLVREPRDRARRAGFGRGERRLEARLRGRRVCRRGERPAPREGCRASLALPGGRAASLPDRTGGRPPRSRDQRWRASIVSPLRALAGAVRRVARR